MDNNEAIEWLKAIKVTHIHGGDEEYDKLSQLRPELGIRLERALGINEEIVREAGGTNIVPIRKTPLMKGKKISLNYNVTLNDYQVNQLLSLCRKMEGLSESELVEKIRNLQDTARRIGEAGEKAEQVKETVSSLADSVKTFFLKAADFFAGLFGRK